MRHLHLGVLAAVVTFSASIFAAQDSKKDAAEEPKCCGKTAHQLFCGQEKCDSDKCKQTCEKAGATLQAVGGKIKEMAKKEWADKACECCQKAETKPCEKCQEFCKDVVVPQVKERITTRTKDASIKHAVKKSDGKTEEVACTFLSGATCSPCVNEISEKSFGKLKELMAAKQAPKGK